LGVVGLLDRSAQGLLDRSSISAHSEWTAR